MPDTLPDSLEILCCSNNTELTKLPEKLPDNLKELACSNCSLAKLPDALPDMLQTLHCYNNNLTILPDLPESITWITFHGNPLEANYPGIFELRTDAEVVAYVNKCNVKRRFRLISDPDTGA